MPLTPMDIHNKEFKRAALGGFDRNDVDEFLDLVVQEFEQNLRQIADLQEQVATLERRLEEYRSLEDALNRTLVAAQETADEIKAQARKEAQLILREAQQQSQSVLRDGHQQAQALIEAGRSRTERILAENTHLQRVTDVLRHQLRALLQAQLDLLDRGLPDETVLEQTAAEAERQLGHGHADTRYAAAGAELEAGAEVEAGAVGGDDDPYRPYRLGAGSGAAAGADLEEED